MSLTPQEIDALARKPAVVTGDAGSVTQRSADDEIKLDQYAVAKEAAANGKPALRIFKIVPPGAV